MPQLDSSTYLAQLFWLFVFFVTIMIFSARVTLPRLGKIINKRHELIEGTREEAELLRVQAETENRNLADQLEHARKQSREIVNDISRHVSADQSKKKLEISKSLKSRFDERNRSILSTQDKAIADGEMAARELAELMTRKALSDILKSPEFQETETLKG